jgi:protein-tyrosine kinase
MSVVERALGKLRGTSGSDRPGQLARLNEHPSPDASHDHSKLTDPERPRVLVNRQALHEAGYLPDQGVDRQFADEFRHIKRSLLARTFAKPAHGAIDEAKMRLIMMASALPGDGKTFTSINLALSLARESNVEVVLADADVAKSHVTRIFGLDQQPGLVDVLSEDVRSIDAVVLSTDIPRLAILPAGTRRPDAPELMSSGRLLEALRQLVARNPRRIVLLDSAPLLACGDARALAECVGQIQLIVRAYSTPKQALKTAIDQLGDPSRISIILNDGRQGIVESIYGYGGYGVYGEDYKKSDQ